MIYYTLNGCRYRPVATTHGIVLQKAGKVKVAPGQMSLFGEQEHREGETRTNAAGHQEVLQGGRWHLQGQPQAQPQQQAQAQAQTQPQQAQAKPKAAKMTPQDIAKDLQAFSQDKSDHEWVLELATELSPKELKARRKEHEDDIKGAHDYLEDEVTWMIPAIHLAQQLQPQLQDENTYNAVANLAQSKKRLDQAIATNPHDPHVKMAQQIVQTSNPEIFFGLLDESPQKLSKQIDEINQEIKDTHENIRQAQRDIQLVNKAIEYAPSLRNDEAVDEVWSHLGH